MKVQNYLKAFLPWQSDFDRWFVACYRNHRGWAKMKKYNKRVAKKRERRVWRKEVREWI